MCSRGGQLTSGNTEKLFHVRYSQGTEAVWCDENKYKGTLRVIFQSM